MSLPPAAVALVARQVKQLTAAPFAGVRYVPSDSLETVLADVDGPAGTPYAGGVFRVRLSLGADFPAAPPKGAARARGDARACGAPLTRAFPPPQASS